MGEFRGGGKKITGKKKMGRKNFFTGGFNWGGWLDGEKIKKKKKKF